MLTTNQKEIVKSAKICYENYPTIVNALRESGISYKNTKEDYAMMDNKFSGSQMGIGWSSNLAQLAMTYYWTELNKENPNDELLNEYYDNFVILSVLAQVEIDSCKRLYEIDSRDEIKRISQLPSMVMTKTITGKNGNCKTIKCDFPEFMKYTREVKYTKDGKELSYDIISKNKSKLNNRINYDLECPMNWLQEHLNKIQGASTAKTIPTKEFFIKMKGEGNRRQMSKIRALVELYDREIRNYMIFYHNENESSMFYLVDVSREILEQLSKIKIGNVITINRLIETALGLETNNNKSLFYKDSQKYTRKTLNLLYKMDKNKFLNNFIC